MYTKNAHANTTKTTQVQARSLAQGAKLVRVLNDPLAALSKTLAAALRAEFADIQARTGVSMPSLNSTDFRGGDACTLEPYSTATAAPGSRRSGGRVLASVNDEPVHLANLTRNESVFASEVSTRRYKDVNSADTMAELVEESLGQDGGGEGGAEIANGTSRLALLELLVPATIACMENETMAMQKMKEFLLEALQRSSATSIAAITPTSFVTLDSAECDAPPSQRRRLLQTQTIRYFRSRTEIVFTPAKVEDTAVKPIIVQPTTILRNLPGDVQLVRIQAVPTNNDNAVEVAAAWGDGELPALVLIDPVHTVTISLPEEPTELIRALHISIIASLVLAVFNLCYSAWVLSSLDGGVVNEDATPKSMPMYTPLSMERPEPGAWAYPEVPRWEYSGSQGLDWQAQPAIWVPADEFVRV